jgi:hypothetical protein
MPRKADGIEEIDELLRANKELCQVTVRKKLGSSSELIKTLNKRWESHLTASQKQSTTFTPGEWPTPQGGDGEKGTTIANKTANGAVHKNEDPVAAQLAKYITLRYQRASKMLWPHEDLLSSSVTNARTFIVECAISRIKRFVCEADFEASHAFVQSAAQYSSPANGSHATACAAAAAATAAAMAPASMPNASAAVMPGYGTFWRHVIPSVWHPLMTEKQTFANIQQILLTEVTPVHLLTLLNTMFLTSQKTFCEQVLCKNDKFSEFVLTPSTADEFQSTIFNRQYAVADFPYADTFFADEIDDSVRHIANKETTLLHCLQEGKQSVCRQARTECTRMLHTMNIISQLIQMCFTQPEAARNTTHMVKRICSRIYTMGESGRKTSQVQKEIMEDVEQWWKDCKSDSQSVFFAINQAFYWMVHLAYYNVDFVMTVLACLGMDDKHRALIARIPELYVAAWLRWTTSKPDELKPLIPTNIPPHRETCLSHSSEEGKSVSTASSLENISIVSTLSSSVSALSALARMTSSTHDKLPAYIREAQDALARPDLSSTATQLRFIAVSMTISKLSTLRLKV